ncbi:MAG: TMEM175 family protein [Sphingomonas bacterium]
MTTGSRDRPDHPLERLIFFSDAVFAIAITLLIIEVHAPHVPQGSPDKAYIDALLHLFPNLVGFFISFFVIGAFWAGHHRAFALAGHYSEKLNGPNLMMLCSVAFMPFTTAFMSSNMGMTVPALVYAISLMVTGLLNIRLIRIVTSPPVVSESVPRDRIAYVRARGPAVVLGAFCAALIALWDPRWSQMGLATIPIWLRLLRNWTTRRLTTNA